jgi:hypothetical protein
MGSPGRPRATLNFSPNFFTTCQLWPKTAQHRIHMPQSFQPLSGDFPGGLDTSRTASRRLVFLAPRSLRGFSLRQPGEAATQTQPRRSEPRLAGQWRAGARPSRPRIYVPRGPCAGARLRCCAIRRSTMADGSRPTTAPGLQTGMQMQFPQNPKCYCYLIISVQFSQVISFTHLGLVLLPQCPIATNFRHDKWKHCIAFSETRREGKGKEDCFLFPTNSSST